MLGALGFVAFMTTVLLTVTVRPGEAKLTAPLFCGDDTPDPFVVVDSHSVQPGETSYNFSLYCMGPRGQTEEVGFLRPSLVLTAGHATLIALLVAVVLIAARRRARHALPSIGRRDLTLHVVPRGMVPLESEDLTGVPADALGVGGLDRDDRPQAGAGGGLRQRVLADADQAPGFVAAAARGEVAAVDAGPAVGDDDRAGDDPRHPRNGSNRARQYPT